MRSKLNQRERERVKRLWYNEDALGQALWASLPADLSREFDAYVVETMAEEGKHVVPEGGNFYGGEAARRVMEMVHGWLSNEFDRYADALREICEQVDYCAKRRAKVFEAEGWAVAIAVGDALLQIVTHIPVPIAVLTVYAVKRGILDNICQCNEKARPA